ncbi:hypothetical protein [Parafrankia sp. EUN1f]|uniref:hypothetical protein n=1 Tax=Parafrankia sp. EUN1f TaxID=102897 RepID=UPI0001C43AF3|nr:hypothetical protein [Parafrankia sp. EUN1f]EFC82570.1 hypothetical protein FrEUN1fDRAFT_4293 [Parafrankia sp. EUN1f]
MTKWAAAVADKVTTVTVPVIHGTEHAAVAVQEKAAEATAPARRHTSNLFSRLEKGASGVVKGNGRGRSSVGLVAIVSVLATAGAVLLVVVGRRQG